MKKIFIPALLIIHSAAISQSISNQVISSSGNHTATGTHSLSWTMGEPATTTLSSSNNILTQGFHQPEVNLSGISDVPADGEVSVYPVPTQGDVNINFNGLAYGEYVISVYDLNGKLLQGQTIWIAANEQLHTISLASYANSTYLVAIRSTSNSINKSFRVVKKD